MLAYFRDTSSGVALEVVGADGRGHRRIVTDVDHRLHEGVPAWSPDSKETAYAFEGDDERFVIRIVNVEEGQTRLVQVSRAPELPAEGEKSDFPAVGRPGRTVLVDFRTRRRPVPSALIT
jgi:hypothetical protein